MVLTWPTAVDKHSLAAIAVRAVLYLPDHSPAILGCEVKFGDAGELALYL